MKYNLAFTAGALLYKEAREYLMGINDIHSYKEGKEVPDASLLSTNSESSRKRLKAELDKRFQIIEKPYLDSFEKLSARDQKCLLFLAFCKTYSIMTEFVIEVVYEKWKIFDFDLSTYDFEYFLNEKLNEEKKENITDKTKYKLAQVALKTLKEVGLFSEGKIQPVKPSLTFIDLLKEQNDLWFLNCLLITNSNQLV